MSYQTLLVIVPILLIIILIVKLVWNKFKAYEALKYEFITIIAHKFRTPLTQMKWITETLLEKEQDSYKIENLKAIAQSGDHLINLTGTLIEITDSASTTLASYTFEKANICEEVKKVLDSLKDSFHEKNIFLSLKCDPTEIYANVDKPRMDFVFQTLFENAIHYSPTGRNVEVVVSILKHKVVVSVKDFGIGIAGDDMQNIFKKFFRSTSAQNMDTEGFGVGLYLARSIVKRHKGEIKVSSQGVEKGSTFSVVLPLLK